MSDYQKEMQAIDRLIADLYSSICFEKGEQPPLETLTKVFIPGGKMINNDGEEPLIFTAEEYIARFRDPDQR